MQPCDESPVPLNSSRLSQAQPAMRDAAVEHCPAPGLTRRHQWPCTGRIATLACLAKANRTRLQYAPPPTSRFALYRETATFLLAGDTPPRT